MKLNRYLTLMLASSLFILSAVSCSSTGWSGSGSADFDTQNPLVFQSEPYDVRSTCSAEPVAQTFWAGGTLAFSDTISFFESESIEDSWYWVRPYSGDGILIGDVSNPCKERWYADSGSETERTDEAAYLIDCNRGNQ
jgi:hypothetical protein